MKFLKRRIGKFYPYNQRTKWYHEISGFTIRQLLWVIPRIIVLTPLAILYGIFSGLVIALETLTDVLSDWMR